MDMLGARFPAAIADSTSGEAVRAHSRERWLRFERWTHLYRHRAQAHTNRVEDNGLSPADNHFH
jgi:hypothetical protein